MALPLKDKFKTILKLILEPKILISLLSLRTWGYLVDMGWFNSFKLGRPVDNAERPIPWFTYPAIEFLSDRLNKSLNVFEFGCGNSTLFFSERVKEIWSVEHTKNWYEKVSANKPENVEIIFVRGENPESYTEPLRKSQQKFDIIIIDGIYRNECLVESIKHLSECGIIILDDSERADYSNGIDMVISNGYKRLEFWGISPGFLYKKSTTFLYRSNNCLKI